MTIRSILQGEWLGHPLHPAVVHVIVALWPMTLVFDILTNAGIGGNALVRTAVVAIAAGLIVALVAVPSGLADWWGIKRDRAPWRLGLYHMLLNLLTAVLFAFNLGLRVGDAWDATYTPPLPLALSAIGTVILGVSGYLGGRMVYQYGTSVARQSKAQWRAVALAGGANVPKED